MFAFLLQGAALGVTAAAAPGPYQAFLINQTLTRGWQRSAIITLAPLLSDGPIVVLILFLLNQLPPSFLGMVSLGGGAFALYMAWKLFQTWRAAPAGTGQNLTPSTGGLMRGVLMNVLSPGPYTFWTLVNGPLLLSALRLSVWHAGAFLLGFYSIFIGGMLVLVALFHQARRFGPQAVRWLTLASIVILGIFALVLLRQGVTTLI